MGSFKQAGANSSHPHCLSFDSDTQTHKSKVTQLSANTATHKHTQSSDHEAGYMAIRGGGGGGGGGFTQTVILQGES